MLQALEFGHFLLLSRNPAAPRGVRSRRKETQRHRRGRKSGDHSPVRPPRGSHGAISQETPCLSIAHRRIIAAEAKSRVMGNFAAAKPAGISVRDFMISANKTLESTRNATDISTVVEAIAASPRSRVTGSARSTQGAPVLSAILQDSVQDAERYVQDYRAGLGAE